MIARAGVSAGLRLGDATEDEAAARRWLGRKGLDGIVAKRLDLGYLPGERAMQKFKVGTTVDCVVAGLYRKGGTQAVQHLLLGLYDEEGKLNCVGRTRIYGCGGNGAPARAAGRRRRRVG